MHDKSETTAEQNAVHTVVSFFLYEFALYIFFRFFFLCYSRIPGRIGQFQLSDLSA